MNISEKQSRLEKLYALFEESAAEMPSACREQCADCCTRNVTVASLEGMWILDRLNADGVSRLYARTAGAGGLDRFRPVITTNALAEHTMSGEDPPEEDCRPEWTPCALLEERLCTIYGLRPFSCRCMNSKTRCGEIGAADMDEYLITLSTVFQQVIEHLDVPGFTGNFLDVMTALKEEEHRSLYRAGMLRGEAVGLLSNRPLTMLMVPPEHRARIQPVVESIQQIMQ